MIRTTALAVLVSISFTALAANEANEDTGLAKARQTAQTVCAACHGTDGNSPTSANPIIAGQIPEYLLKQLKEFQSIDGKPAVRNNPIMAGMTAALNAEDMKALARYFSQQKQKPSAATSAKLVETGRTLWRRGDSERGIAACAGCHGPTGAGVPAQYPRLSGQYAEYIEIQLKNFRSEERSNDPEGMMRNIADRMSDKQIKAVADYIAGLR